MKATFVLSLVAVAICGASADLHDELIGKEYHSHGFNPGTFSTDDQAVQYAKELKQFIDSGMDDNQMPSKKPDYLGKLNFEKGDEAPDSINIEYDSHERDQDGRIHHYRGESVVSAITHNNGGALDLNCNDQIDVLAGGWRGRDGEEEEDHFGADFYYLDLDERGIPRDWIINKWTDHDETSDGEYGFGYEVAIPVRDRLIEDMILQDEMLLAHLLDGDGRTDDHQTGDDDGDNDGDDDDDDDDDDDYDDGDDGDDDYNNNAGSNNNGIGGNRGNLRRNGGN